MLKLNNIYHRDKEEKEQAEDEKEYDEAGEVLETGEGGVWNKSMSEQQPQPAAAPKPVSKPTGKYVPPSRRQGAMATSGKYVPPSRQMGKPQKTFKTDSIIDFPDLNAAEQDQKFAQNFTVIFILI